MKMISTKATATLMFLLTLNVNSQIQKSYGFEKEDYAQNLISANDSCMFITGATGYVAKIDTLGQVVWEYEVLHTDEWFENIITDAILYESRDFIFVGYSIHKGGKGHTSFIAKCDNEGDTLFTNAFGIEIGECDVNSLIQTKDGGFAIIGHSTIQGYRNKDVLLIKTDSSGGLIWSKTYGGDKDDSGLGLIETDEGELILIGETESYGEAGKNIYIVKTDVLGDTIWTKAIGGNRYDIPTGILELPSSEFLISGTTSSYGVHYHDDDMFLLKIDTNGNTLWYKTYGGIKDDVCNAILKTDDNNILLVGTTESFGHGQKDILLIKTDLSGQTIFSKAYGGSSIEEGRDLCIHPTGNYLIGDTRTFSTGKQDICIIQVNDNGEARCNYKDSVIPTLTPVWGEYVGGKVGNGCFQFKSNLKLHRANAVVNEMCECQFPKANFHISQTDGTADYTDESTWLESWFWDFGDGYTSTEQNPSHRVTDSAKVCLTVTNQCGTDTYCETVYGGVGIEENFQTQFVSFFPNPANDFINITLDPNLKAKKLEILNVMGELVFTSSNLNTNSHRINIKDLKNGLYYLRVKTSSGKEYTKKIIKQ